MGGDSLTLVSIELENFKSFLGHHVLGPFLDLTAVVGPNGGGNHLLLNFNRQIKHPGCHRFHSASETHFEEAQASEGAYLQRRAREVSGEQA